MSRTPVTEAGRALVQRLGWFASEKGGALLDGILAIEEEARTAVPERTFRYPPTAGNLLFAFRYATGNDPEPGLGWTLLGEVSGADPEKVLIDAIDVGNRDQP